MKGRFILRALATHRLKSVSKGYSAVHKRFEINSINSRADHVIVVALLFFVKSIVYADTILRIAKLLFFERNLKKLVVQKNFAFYIFHLSISTRNINISVRENVENARDQKKKKEKYVTVSLLKFEPGPRSNLKFRSGMEDATTRAKVIESSPLFLRTTGVC